MSEGTAGAPTPVPAVPDLVYVVGGATNDDRADLRHSLRSIAANLRIPFRDVWIVGDVPGWVRGVRPLPLTPLAEKFSNQRQSLTAYVNHPDAADRFILLNDDMFVTEPIDALQTCRNRNPASKWGAAEQADGRSLNGWHRTVLATAAWVAERTRTDPFIYEVHTPLLFDTSEVARLLAEYPANKPFAAGELYPIAGRGGEGTHCGNAKVKRGDSFTEKVAQPMPYLSGNPDSWPAELGDYIRAMFPTPSRWEAPMLNVEAITNQRIAVGLVENPACWALRDLASEVPADEAIVELGAFKGRSTGWLALGAQNGNGARVVSVDPWENGEEVDADYLDTAVSVREYRMSETRVAYEKHLDATGIRPFVDTIQGTAVEAAKNYAGPPVALLWHDALHRRKDVAADLRAWMPHLTDNAVVVLHDVGDPRFEVEAGARAAIVRRKGWEWEDREIHLWPKQPDRRGYMIVRRAA